MSSQKFDIFRCPHCAQQGTGRLSMVKENWLGCVDCGRNYPIVKEIPVLMPDEGDKWSKVSANELPDMDYYDRFSGAVDS